jgi:carbonic anhydrase
MADNLPIARRKLLQFGALASLTGALITAIGFPGKSATAKETLIAPESVGEDATPEQVLQALLDGNKRFVEHRPQAPNQDYIRLSEVAKGQKPLVSILSCADSRVPVEIIFDRGLGDLFVVRDAGNIATPEEIGSLEYGTAVLGSKVVMVLGHEECGAVKAALDNKPVPGQIGSIIAAIQPAIDRSNKDSKTAYVDTIKRNVLLQKEKLEASPVLYELVAAGNLKIVGAYYSLSTGEVTILS